VFTLATVAVHQNYRTWQQSTLLNERHFLTAPRMVHTKVGHLVKPNCQPCGVIPFSLWRVHLPHRHNPASFVSKDTIYCTKQEMN